MNFLLYLFFLLAVFALSMFTFLPKRFLIRLVNFILRVVLRYRFEVVKSNLYLCYVELDKSLLKNIYNYLARYITENLVLYFGKKSDVQGKVKFLNPEILEEQINNGNNVIIYAAHYGNWEYFSVLLPQVLHNIDVYGLYRPISNPYIDRYILRKRGRFGLKLLEKNKALKFILRNDQASVYIFIADQSPHINQDGRLVSFMGVETRFEAASERLIKDYDFQPFYLECSVLKDNYKVNFIRMDDSSNDIISEYASFLSKQIEANPAPWLWTHRRWKHKNTIYTSKYL